LNLHKKTWTSGLELESFSSLATANQTAVTSLLRLTKEYNKSVEEEGVLTKDQLKTRHVGKQDPKKHLEIVGVESMARNIVQCLGSMLDAVSF
jgi:26S proteasome regulatory subunit N11